MKYRGLLIAAMLLLAGWQLAWAAEGDAMPEMPAEGSIVHTEFYASDLAAMQSFYGDLFGWTFEPMGEEYVMFQDGGGAGGGFTTEGGPLGGEPGRMTTVVYLWCPDLDAKLAEIEAHGGSTAVPPTPIPGYGSFALFIDPSGNAVGLFSAGEMTGAPADDAHAGHDHAGHDHDHAGHNH